MLVKGLRGGGCTCTRPISERIAGKAATKSETTRRKFVSGIKGKVPYLKRLGI